MRESRLGFRLETEIAEAEARAREILKVETIVFGAKLTMIAFGVFALFSAAMAVWHWVQ